MRLLIPDFTLVPPLRWTAPYAGKRSNCLAGESSVLPFHSDCDSEVLSCGRGFIKVDMCAVTTRSFDTTPDPVPESRASRSTHVDGIRTGR